MQIKFIPRKSFVKVPWKNGLGFTHEIAKLNQELNERFIWRLSIAEVNQNGPFSSFEGYDRNISVLNGAGMTLQVNDKSSGHLTPFQSFEFSGSAQTYCELFAGKIDDFNLIFDPAFVKGTVEWFTPAQAIEMTLPVDAIVFLISGLDETTIRIQDSNFNLGHWDILQIVVTREVAKLSIPGQLGAKVGLITIQSRK